MKVYIDDIRDPKKYLTPEQADGIVWIKEAWNARNFLVEHESVIEVLHLDNYLDDEFITGTDIFFMVAGETIWGDRSEWANLKTIYLHSSDTDVIEKLMKYKDELQTAGVELIDNHQERNY
ncbi:hypothetical protein [Yersinia phage fHe-Yen9-03]|uniref:Cyclic-phosphate processing Receiver domain-containing protein n=1 Tax=Yersinia phage fHe-Yen9-03 TaxID=2052743 RepID=A0A2C9CZN0_9CAUD|nr:hypothetical protein [Yersinia phage fHe-Yen9-03]